MKLSKEQFRQFVLEEVKKLLAEEVVQEPVVAKDDSTTTPLNESLIVNEEKEKDEPKVEVAEVKRLAEEFTRMKELVDFRSPLLRKENQ